MKRKPQPGLALLITLIVSTCLQAMAVVPMLAVLLYSTAGFGPGGQFNRSNPWLPVLAALAPLVFMLALSVAAWPLYAAGWRKAAVALSAAAFAAPLAEAVVVCVILLYLMSLP